MVLLLEDEELGQQQQQERITRRMLRNNTQNLMDMSDKEYVALKCKLLILL